MDRYTVVDRALSRIRARFYTSFVIFSILLFLSLYRSWQSSEANRDEDRDLMYKMYKIKDARIFLESSSSLQPVSNERDERNYLRLVPVYFFRHYFSVITFKPWIISQALALKCQEQ
jgi:hypothetical protein